MREVYGEASEGGGLPGAVVGAERVHGFPGVCCGGGGAGGGVAVRPGQWGSRPLKQPPRRQEEACTFPSPSPFMRLPRDACFLQPFYGLAMLNCQLDLAIRKPWCEWDGIYCAEMLLVNQKLKLLWLKLFKSSSMLHLLPFSLVACTHRSSCYGLTWWNSGFTHILF